MRGRVLGVFTSSAYAAGPVGAAARRTARRPPRRRGRLHDPGPRTDRRGPGHDRAPGPARPRPPRAGAARHRAEAARGAARGRGQGDSKPPTSRPTGHPAGRHDAPTPAATHRPTRPRSVGPALVATKRPSSPWRVRRDLSRPRTRMGSCTPHVPPDETAAARILDLLGRRESVRPSACPASTTWPSGGLPRRGRTATHPAGPARADDRLRGGRAGSRHRWSRCRPDDHRAGRRQRRRRVRGGCDGAVAGAACRQRGARCGSAGRASVTAPCTRCPTRARCSRRWPRRSSAPATPTRPSRWLPTRSRSAEVGARRAGLPRRARPTSSVPPLGRDALSRPPARTAPDLRAVESAAALLGRSARKS